MRYRQWLDKIFNLSGRKSRKDKSVRKYENIWNEQKKYRNIAVLKINIFLFFLRNEIILNIWVVKRGYFKILEGRIFFLIFLK